MKRLIFIFTLIFVYIATYATGLEADIIYIDGAKWMLLGKPICSDSVLMKDMIAALPPQRSTSTANWDGYTAYWSIQQEKLCLDSIEYKLYDSETKKYRSESLPQDVLIRVFEKYTDGKRIVASWFSYDIRVASGKRIYYEHTSYERNYENERIISIERGKVRSMKDFHNYILKGFSFSQLKNNADMREMFPLHIEQYPELVDVKRIIFYIRRARVDAQGNLVECEVKVYRPNDNPRLAAEMAEMLMAYHPWQVYYINGEYQALGIQGCIIRYDLDE